MARIMRPGKFAGAGFVHHGTVRRPRVDANLPGVTSAYYFQAYFVNVAACIVRHESRVNLLGLPQSGAIWFDNDANPRARLCFAQ
jgi:hypothetical protein